MAEPLRGLAAAVDTARIQSLLITRSPQILSDPDTQHLLVEVLRGVASEVSLIVGPAPVGAVLDLATWAVTLGVAASLEEALFPEQQGGDSGRAEQLQRRYLGVLADLRRSVAAAGGTSEAGVSTFAGLVPLGGGSWS